MMWRLYEKIHTFTAVVDESEEVTGSNPVEVLIFFFPDLVFPNSRTAMITLHFYLQPHYKYELFHIYVISFHCTGRYELNKLTSLQSVSS